MGKSRNLKKYPDFVTFYLPVLIWMALIFTLSSIPGSTLKDIEFPYAHPIAHSMLYGVLYYLSFRALSHHRLGQMRTSFSLAASFLIVALYGMSDEFHQSFVPGRTEELKDFIIDLSAALVVMIGVIVSRKFWKRSRAQDSHQAG